MSRSLRVVIVDSSSTVLEQYRATLEQLGHRIVCAAHTAAELLANCSSRDADVMIVDLRLSDIDGIELAKQFTADHAMPVILAAKSFTDEDVRRAQQNHVMSYLIKPASTAHVESSIAVALTRFGTISADDVPPPPTTE